MAAEARAEVLTTQDRVWHGGKARGSFGQMLEGLVDMEKPQETFGKTPQNDRLKPFVPPITDKPFSVVPLNLDLKEGYTDSTRGLVFCRNVPMRKT